MENRNYAKLLENNQLEYAPSKFKENNQLIIPRQNDDAFFFKRGYYKVIDNKPHFDTTNQYIEILKWNVDETFHTLTSVYVVREIQKEEPKNKVKRYSKLKITLFCIEMGIWEQVKGYLEKIGYYDLFVMAQFFLETDEYFTKGLQMFKQAQVDSGENAQDLDDLIDTMLNFSQDGYVIVEDDGDIIQMYEAGSMTGF